MKCTHCFQILNNPVWMCKLKEEEKKKALFVSDYRRSYDRQGKKMETLIG